MKTEKGISLIESAILASLVCLAVTISVRGTADKAGDTIWRAHEALCDSGGTETCGGPAKPEIAGSDEDSHAAMDH